jgi:hypothetical protein
MSCKSILALAHNAAEDGPRALPPAAFMTPAPFPNPGASNFAREPGDSLRF